MIKLQPTLVVIAGPNGAGKTTLVRKINSELLRDTLLINPDEIVKELKQQYPAQDSKAINLKAGRIALRLTKECLLNQSSFIIETTLAGKKPLETLTQAKNLNYKITLIYIGLATVSHCIRRVQERVKLGGHDIPLEDIIRRYQRSIEKLPKALEIADSALIIDNSLAMHRPLLLCLKGIPSEIYQPTMPDWLAHIIDYTYQNPVISD